MRTKLIILKQNTFPPLKLWTSLPLLSSLAIFFFLSESPRWLLRTGRIDKYKKEVNRAAKWNRVT